MAESASYLQIQKIYADDDKVCSCAVDSDVCNRPARAARARCGDHFDLLYQSLQNGSPCLRLLRRTVSAFCNDHKIYCKVVCGGCCQKRRRRCWRRRCGCCSCIIYSTTLSTSKGCRGVEGRWGGGGTDFWLFLLSSWSNFRSKNFSP